jgi:hypothetical protein
VVLLALRHGFNPARMRSTTPRVRRMRLSAPPSDVACLPTCSGVSVIPVEEGMSKETGEARGCRNARRLIAERPMGRRTGAEVGVADLLLASSYVQTCTSVPKRTRRRLGIARVGVTDWRLHSCSAATSTRTRIPNQEWRMQGGVAGVTDVATRSGFAITSATRHASAPMATEPAGGGVSDFF